MANPKHLTAGLLALSFLGACPPSSALPRYLMYDLGSLDHPVVRVEDINNSGQVVGEVGNSAFTATIAGGIQRLDIGLEVNSNFGGTYATGINNAGQISGIYYAPNQGNPSAYVYFPSAGAGAHTITIVAAGETNGQQSWGEAWAINDHGQVSGQFSTLGGDSPFTWTASAGTQVLPIQGRMDGWTRGINNAGDFLASGCLVGNGCMPYVFSTLHGTVTPLTPLDASSTSSSAYGINDSGLSVGLNDQYAVLWDGNGVPLNLGELYSGGTSVANSINNNNTVVGASGSSGFIWTHSDGMVDLNTLIDSLQGADTLKLISADSISDAGYIAGVGSNGHLVVLAPIASVPEPRSIVLIVSGLLLLCLKRNSPTKRNHA